MLQDDIYAVLRIDLNDECFSFFFGNFPKFQNVPEIF